MSVPQIVNFQCIDAKLDNVITFTFQGNQVFGNEIQIYNNATNVLIYDNLISSFQLQHTIPKNTLTNGGAWYIKVRVYDKDNNYSLYSPNFVFYTHETPILSTNIEQNQIIKNSYLPVNLSYLSADGEALNTWKLILYNSGNIIISQTDQILAASSMGTTINGLENNHAYGVEVLGTTVNGMNITTGLISFSVTYIEPTNFNKVILTNIPEDGTIKIESHLINIDGKSNPTPPLYIGNSRVDLRNSNTSVWLDDGFLIKGDFSKQIILQDITPYSICYIATNGSEILTVKYIISTFDSGEKGYFLLEINNGVLTTRCATEPIDVLTGQQIYLLIKRVNGLWSIKVFDYSLTINEWNTLNLTNDGWNTKNLTIEQLTLQGKTLLNN